MNDELIVSSASVLSGDMSPAAFTPETAYRWLYTGALVILGLILLCCLLRAILGPRIVDRVIAINMMSTDIVIIICIMCYMMSEGYLADVAMIYTMLSFLAVVLLCKIYMGSYRARRSRMKGGKNDA